MHVPTLRVALITAALLTSMPARASGTTIDFPFRDSELLLPGQMSSGRAFVPDTVQPGAPAPVVILLHGTNSNGPLHRWLGGSTDIRADFATWIGDGKISPAILVGPSQTAHATSGSGLWQGLDWSSLVDAAADALGSRASVDRARVIVVGHSGAGCNPEGGLVGMAGAGRGRLPLALVAIDTCMDGDVARGLARALPDSSVAVFYQSQYWPRDVEGFKAVLNPGSFLDASLVVEEIAAAGPDAHNSILPSAVLRALQWLIPTGTAPKAAESEGHPWSEKDSSKALQTSLPAVSWSLSPIANPSSMFEAKAASTYSLPPAGSRRRLLP